VRDLTAGCLDLAADGGTLRIERDPRGLPGWSRCVLLVDNAQPRFLGAENLANIATRLVAHLAGAGPAAGRIAGQPVWWVLSLAEAHHSLYAYLDGAQRVLVWEDGDGRPLTSVLRLSETRYQQWREQLTPLATAPLP
jgi:hypothetical protein